MDVGRLLPSDEGLNHQIVETFATVSESDLSWTEKLWASVFSSDGSMQIDVGMGKYPNRNVLDGFAGVSRGREQWTVRASRELSPDLELPSVGPIHYEVTRPLEAVRFRLEPNDAAAIAFDFEITGITQPLFEDRDRRWDGRGTRVVTDLLRYHQPGSVAGWIEIDGRRQPIEGWCGFRDHSWGVRRNVGAEPADVRQPSRGLAEIDYRMHWAPLLLRADGQDPYELHYYVQGTPAGDIYSAGRLNRADGSHVRAWRITPELQFEPSNRRLLGGRVTFDLEDGSTRVVSVSPMCDTGFHLGAGLYLEYEGQHHGAWRGRLHVEGDRYADCATPEAARKLHQLRDCVVRVQEGDATGWGVVESIMTGAWPQSGLSGTDSFL